MTLKPIFRRAAADRDIVNAVIHYRDNAGEKTAVAFSQALCAAFTHIAHHPASGSSRYAPILDVPELRSWPLKRFPHLVFYMEVTNHIEVWRILHQERDILAWLGER